MNTTEMQIFFQIFNLVPLKGILGGKRKTENSSLQDYHHAEIFELPVEVKEASKKSKFLDFHWSPPFINSSLSH
jgi:hypothetical protein